MKEHFVIEQILFWAKSTKSQKWEGKCGGLKIMPGGLDSRDQLRSRSRFLDLSRLTFENRRDCPSRRDQNF